MTVKKQSLDSSIPFPWLTTETALWGLLLAAALGLRLSRLDAALLNSGEARNALAAWRFAYGHGAPASSSYSPALFSGQWLTFFIFGASDFTARLLPALAGTALTLAPVLLRQQLGRLGALIAGALLALSPTALTLSRTASGDVLVALGALLLVGGMSKWASHSATPQRGGLVNGQIGKSAMQCAALGIALMLTSSPLAYSALLTLGVALLLVVLADPQSQNQVKRNWNAFRTTPDLIPHTLGVFAASFVLFSTAFGWNLGGLGAAAGQLSRWLGGFVHWPDSLSLGYPVLILILYEPLLLLLGGVGAALATLRGKPTTLFLAVWAITALALALIRPGHGPGDALLVVVPLACLGGLALDALLKSTRRWGHWLNEGMYLVISAPLWAYLLLNLAAYSNQSWRYTDINLLSTIISLPTYLSMAIAALFLLLILAIGIGMIQGPGPMLRGLGLSTTLALLLFTVAAAWGVSQNRPADPREPLVLEPTAPEVRMLRENLIRLSNERYKDAHSIDLTVLTDDPALAWALRDFHRASFATATSTPSLASAVISPEMLGAPPLGENHVGQSFTLRQSWRADNLACRWNQAQSGFDQVRQLDCSALVKWFLFRRSPEQPAEERVVLWVRR